MHKNKKIGIVLLLLGVIAYAFTNIKKKTGTVTASPLDTGEFPTKGGYFPSDVPSIED